MEFVALTPRQFSDVACISLLSWTESGLSAASVPIYVVIPSSRRDSCTTLYFRLGFWYSRFVRWFKLLCILIRVCSLSPLLRHRNSQVPLAVRSLHTTDEFSAMNIRLLNIFFKVGEGTGVKGRKSRRTGFER